MNIYVCTDCAFPRCGAPSNYIENFLKAIQTYCDRQYVIATSQEKKEWDSFEGVEYCYVPYKCSTKLTTLKNRLYVANQMIDILETLQLISKDIILIYSENYFLISKLAKYSREKNIKAFSFVVEWYSHKHFKYGYLDIFNYWYYLLGFHFGIKKTGNVIAISSLLREHFLKKGCQAFVVPPLCQQPYTEKEIIKKDNKLRFIYSGTYQGKDDMQGMIEAFCLLPDRELSRVEFHITGTSEEAFWGGLDISSECKNRLIDVVIVHEWMKYEELLQLYENMDFLLIMRSNSRPNIANYPSKVPEMMRYGVIPVVSNVGDCGADMRRMNIGYNIDGDSPEKCMILIMELLLLSNDEIVAGKNKILKDSYNYYYQNWDNKIAKGLGI